ncbi:MAG: hypothetical protein FAZ92_02292 [Accumulibacter sp.]|nr:MAG: hypothetical protein FAZ92_02292 [Accumulibacter sp.]
MPGEHQVGFLALPLLQREHLIAEQIEGQLCIEQRVVQLCTPEPAVLVVLDEVVIRVARKGQRIQPQRIDDRQFEESQSRRDRGEMRAVEGEQIVAEDEAATAGQCIETGERRRQIADAAVQPLAAVAAHCSQLPDAPTAQPDLQIDRQAAWPERPFAAAPWRSIAHGRDDNRRQRCRLVDPLRRSLPAPAAPLSEAAWPRPATCRVHRNQARPGQRRR